MTYEEYETLVKRYFETLLKNVFSQRIEIRHQENLPTVSGREYNIDLNYRFKIGATEYLTIIECKHWKNAVSRDIVLSLKEKANELSAHKAILVTTKGFQKGAIEYALEKGIGLIKMTTKGEKETYFNFTGVDLANVVEELTRESPLPDNRPLDNNLGIIFPEKTVSQYLHAKYGRQLIIAIEDFRKNADSYVRTEELMSILNTIPDNWYEEYIRIETAGLNMELFNQDEIRFYNVVLYLLKVTKEK